MQSKKPIIVVLFLLFTSTLYSQHLRGHFITTEKLNKGKEYCDDLDFITVDKAETFIFCKSVYTHKYDYRKALNVIEIAQKKYPYSYNIRLEKALALNDLGSHTTASKEIIGLIKLYPNKFELHNYLARIQYENDRVMSVMPFIFSVIINPSNPQASENITFIKRLLSSRLMNWEVDSNAMETLGYTRPNSFDFVKYKLIRDAKYNESDTRLFLINKIYLLANALEETPHNKNGFFWNYYAQYFSELKSERLIETAVDYMLNPSDLSLIHI